MKYGIPVPVGTGRQCKVYRNPYGAPHVVVPHVPEPGDILRVYTREKDLQIGHLLTISPPGYEMPGRVVKRYADDPYYWRPHANGGIGWYDVEVLEKPK